ncbi:MAG: hypothetical protein N3D84_02615 [Candidatus Woesearchaeota archaeon]|nr:hypothetical protein [Candidatus Woesearchaeota archaeon]
MAGIKNRITANIVVLLFVILTFPFIFAQKEANISVNVTKVEKSTSLLTIIFLAVLFAVLLAIVYFMLQYIAMQQKKKRALMERVKSDIEEARYIRDNEEEIKSAKEAVFSSNVDIDKFLKEDERRIINILRQRDGVCSQATLRVVGNFSKASLSRLLKELEDRNIIKKEQRGKKNLVILK